MPKEKTGYNPPSRVKVIACATVIEEMLPSLPSDAAYEVLDFGLHLTPDKLRTALQDSINAAGAGFDAIILGYGLCSMAVIGLTATNCTLVVPRVDDCIAIFLGSHTAYKEQSGKEPGSYYLTKGWIAVGDTPFEEYKHLVERYGEKRARRMIQLTLKNYTRLAYIDTGQYEQERFRDYTRRTAAEFNLRYEEIAGSTALVKKMIYGPWDDDFVVARPGQTITYADFRAAPTAMCNLPGLSLTPPETD
jgi:hypothetical protein